MRKSNLFSALTLGALVAASLSTAALANNGPMGGMGAAPMLNFEAMDADKDGKVTPEEFTAHRAARATEADANKDGAITAEELLAMQDKAMAERKLARATAMLTKLDSNTDGKLSPEELAAAGPQGTMFFDHADTDGDGAVSKAEADAMQAQMAERMGDGEGRGHGKGHGKRGGHGGGMMDWMGGDDN